MSHDRELDAVVTEDVDEDDMPPLVDNPNSSLTYTFYSEMTPLSFNSTPASTATQDGSPQPSLSLISSPPTSPITPDDATPGSSMPVIQSRPHGKRRDPSYIPRPPNAFILFRSAFIREQNIPGKVEGNHSKLSKIIGLYWRQLPAEEREKWEQQAVIAQAEHRARYPDWRFRPGANALAKLKITEGSSTRRRSVRGRPKGSAEDGEEASPVEGKGKSKDKGKSKAKSSRIQSLEETRCAKIADFVAEGIKGEELEEAVKQWEDDRRITRPPPRPAKKRASKSQGSKPLHLHSQSDVIVPPTPSFSTPSSSRPPADEDASSSGSVTPTHTQSTNNATTQGVNESNTPRTPIDISYPTHSPVPLTHMFKRSTSAPAPNKRQSNPPSSGEPSDESSAEDASPTLSTARPGTWGAFKPLVLQDAPTRTHISTHSRRDTVSFPMESTSSTPTFDTPHLTWEEAESQRRIEDMQPSNSWWTNRPPQMETQFIFEDPSQPQQKSVPGSYARNDMGYEGGSHFNGGYMEYHSFDSAQDGSRRVDWRDMSTNSRGTRHGLSTVIDDPYDDCANESPTSSTPATLALPPLSTSGQYYSSPASPMTPSVPSSSFSTLTGWAGDYKNSRSPGDQSWPNHTNPSHQSMDQSAWYHSHGETTWGDERHQLQYSTIAADPHDWDRHEYRASSEMHLQVEPPRQVNFDDEIRRLRSETS